jgi:hypothetical protein
VLTVSPAALTVSPVGASRSYGGSNPDLGGTISGLVNNDVITATYSTNAADASPVGIYGITATLLDPGGVLGNYVVTINSATLTVTTATLTVKANDATKVYGQLNPAFAASYSGFVLGQNASVLGGQLGFGTTAGASSHVGSYLVTPSGLSSSNYTLQYVAGQLGVTAAPLTVTANNATRLFGQVNPAFSASYGGFVNGDSPASLVGTLSFTTTANQSSAPGSYAIVPAGVSSSDYAITFAPGVLTIASTQAGPTFSNLSAPTVVLGQQHTSLGGKIAAGSAIPTGFVTITIKSNSTRQSWSFVASIDRKTGEFSVSVRTSSLRVGSYAVTYSYAGNSTNGAVQATTQLLVVSPRDSFRGQHFGDDGGRDNDCDGDDDNWRNGDSHGNCD